MGSPGTTRRRAWLTLTGPFRALWRRRQTRLLVLAPLAVVVLIVAVLGVLIAVLPSPIGDPEAWQPGPRPAAEGVLAQNTALTGAELLAADQGLQRPEDVAFDAQGRLYTGTADGLVWRLTLGTGGEVAAAERLADLGTGVLGLKVDGTGRVLAAVPRRGLVAIYPDGRHEVLTDRVAGTPITYANELAVARDGTVYFSDSSNAYDRGWPYDSLAGRPHGRLLAYDPATDTTTVVRDRLYFPNGVALPAAGDSVLVAETFRNRILRVWVAGPRTGQVDTFADNLPVSPDNITASPDGTYWVGGGGGPRTELQDTLHASTLLKLALAKLVPFDVLRDIPNRTRYGYLLRLAADGSPVASYHDPTGRVHTVASAEPHGDHVYLGTLYGTAIARVRLD